MTAPTFDELYAESQQIKPTAYRFLRLEELYAQPAPAWLVDQVIPRRGVIAIYGASGAGKSFIALDLGMSAAGCSSWFGRTVENVPVFYVPLEGQAGVGRRVRAWHFEAAGSDRMHDEDDGKCQPFRVMESAEFNLGDPDNVDGMAEAIRSAGGEGGVAIIDTLHCAMSGADENSARDMGLAVEGAKSLQRQIEGLVILVHHSGKDASKGMRGSSALFAALDAVIEVSDTSTGKTWKLTKSKDAETGISAGFRLEVINLSAAGKPVTSCAVVPSTAPAPAAASKPAPRGKNQQAVLAALAEQCKGGPITREAALSAGAEALARQGVKESKRQREASDRAIQALIESGYVRLQAGEGGSELLTTE